MSNAQKLSQLIPIPAGVLKGSGGKPVAATAGTDYLAPPSGTSLIKANSGGALANAVAGTDYVAPIGNDSQLTRQMFIDCGLTFLDKGNSGTSPQTLDYTAGSHQKITATGSFTLSTSNWPPTGNLGVILLEAVNFGSVTVTWPTINWVLPSGATTTSVSTWLAAINGRTAFQTSGTDWIKLWTRDVGTTIYGGFAA